MLTYKKNDCGAIGKLFEAELKRTVGLKEAVSKAGKVDMRKCKKNYEIKQGAGELGNAGDKLLKGCSRVVYVPVVTGEPKSEEDISEWIKSQEGFVLERETFLQCIENAGLLREKISSAGIAKITIQTFWNNKLDKPHGKKYYALLDQLYENCLCTLEDWLEEVGA